MDCNQFCRVWGRRVRRSIIIIGAGLSGLATGCYGRMNGYETTIFDMHDVPGGVCTAWERKGYTIDGAVNWVIGTGPDGMFHRFWRELGVAQNWQVHDHEVAMIAEDPRGRALTVYSDADRLERHMLEIAPEDAGPIRELTGAIRKSSTFTMPVDKPEELYTLMDKIGMIRMLPLLGFMKKWSKVTVADFATRFENPFLREMLPMVFGADSPMVMLIMMLAWQHRKVAGYVIGGALPLARAVEERYRELGGEIHYDSRVEQIMVEDDRAVGVRLTDGSEHRADWVVSAADGRTTIFDMLDGAYVDDEIRARYEHANLFKPLVYVALGIDRRLEELPPAMGGLTFPLRNPITIGGSVERTMCVRTYSFDPTLAPDGKDVLIVHYETGYDYWNHLHRDAKQYRAEKERIARDVIAGLEERFPGITSHVEMTDVATPVTWERYTGNWRGAYEGWMFDEDSFASSMKKTLPGLERFYMAGQWVNPGGGIPTAVMSGNHTIQLICRADGRKFAVVPAGVTGDSGVGAAGR